MRMVLAFLLFTSCSGKSVKITNSHLYVVNDGNAQRVVGFLPSEPIRENNYISAVLFPKRLFLVLSEREIPAYANVLAFTLDKQKKMNRTFLVSEKFEYSGEREFKLLILKRGKVVGEIAGSLERIKPYYEILNKEVVKFRNYWHVYVKVRTIPAMKTHPKLLRVKEGADTFYVLEKANFITKYLGKEENKFHGWYDEWIFVRRYENFPDTVGCEWKVIGEFFGN